MRFFCIFWARFGSSQAPLSLSSQMAEDLGSLLFPSSSVEGKGQIIWVDCSTDKDRNVRKDGWVGG